MGFMFEDHAAQTEAKMRNVIYAIAGCCDHTKTIADEALLEYYTQLIETKAENEFADAFDSINKIVFSRSLDGAGGNTRIVRTKLKDEIDEILKLKQEQGKNILSGV